MGSEKRKGSAVEKEEEIEGKKTKKDEDQAAEEPTDEEVEEFFVILRRMKEATDYFRGNKKYFLTESFRAVAGVAADRKVMVEETVAEVAGEAKMEEKTKAGKGKEVVEENRLQLDLNIAVVVESDGG